MASPTEFGDLASDLDTIYNTYRRSTDTLDSATNQVAPKYSYLRTVDDDFHFNSSMQVLDSVEFSNDSSEEIDTPSARYWREAGAAVLIKPQKKKEEEKNEEKEKNEGEAKDEKNEGKEQLDNQKDSSNSSNSNLNESQPIIIRRGVNDFKFGRTLGEGAYSTVVLGKDKHTGIHYAVKVLNKRHITKEKKVRYVNVEKNALNRLAGRTGIVQLYFTFQDEDSLYFVLSYASKGELLSLLKKHGSLNEDCVRYFGAQILDAIRYMHDNGVIHRDIKPENILLDDRYRIHITDFGTARLLEKRSKTPDDDEEYPLDVRAKSFVGTAEYVSPELLESKYCGKPGDVWAFGCIIYQMIAGKPPFQATNEYLTFQKITKLQYAFSAGFPNVVRDLIKQILVLQPAKRAKIPHIMKHHFFESVDWSMEGIWEKPVPEMGPYKMSAKSMMEKRTQNQRITQKGKVQKEKATEKVTEKVTKERASQKDQKERKPDQRTPSQGLTAASVAAYVLTKKEDNEPVSTPSSRSSSRSADYIPGTNILRPQINTRSYSRASVKKTPPKPRVLEVTPLSSLETAWGAFLVHPDERIVRLGPVYVHREPTVVFEKRNKGLLHNTPLGLAAKLQQINARAPQNPRGSLLSQIVKGSSSGLREGPVEEGAPDESQAIVEHIEEKEKEKDKEEKPKHRSLLQKFRLQAHDEPEDIHPLDKQRTCTVLITTHGRVLVLIRGDGDGPSAHRLVVEIHVEHSFVRFKELVGATSKFQKLLPTTGVFAVESSLTTYVFEVEKHEVSLWTDALAKAKLNQLERLRSKEKVDEEKTEKEGEKTEKEAEKEEGPRTLAPYPSRIHKFEEKEKKEERERAEKERAEKERLEEKLEKERLEKEKADRAEKERERAERIKETAQKNEKPQSHGPHESHSSHMAHKFRIRTNTKRKPPPPPLSPTTASPSDSGLHAALLAVANGQHSAENRRSSFTKERNELPLATVRPGNVNYKNSKMLARSTRKK